MASNFQPDNPHQETRGGAAINKTSIITAAITALMVIMVLAILAPRAFGDNRWLITLVAGAVAFAVVLGIGYARGQ